MAESVLRTPMTKLSGQLLSGIETYLTERSFAIVRGTLPEHQVTWIESNNWKTFVDLARNSGVKLIVLSKTETPRSSKLGIGASDSIGKQLQRYKGQICRLVLVWTKEGMIYALALEADWWPTMEGHLARHRLKKRVIGEARAEESTIEALVPQVLKSFADNGGCRVTQADIRCLLDVRGISLSYHALREVWKRVKERIRNHSSVDRTKAHDRR